MPSPNVSRGCPPTAVVQGIHVSFERVLAETACSRNAVYAAPTGERWVLKVTRLPGIFNILLWPLVVFMSRREYRIYRDLADIDCVPLLGPSRGLRAYFHRFIEGHTLAEHPRGEPLAADFFDRLLACVREVHQRGVFYADLDKKGNIIVGADGRPYLIDFQACIRFGAGALDRRGPLGALFRALAGEDTRHLYKHKRYFQPEALTEAEIAGARRGPVAEGWHRYLVRPLRKLRKLVARAGGRASREKPETRRNPSPSPNRTAETR